MALSTRSWVGKVFSGSLQPKSDWQPAGVVGRVMPSSGPMIRPPGLQQVVVRVRAAGLLPRPQVRVVRLLGAEEPGCPKGALDVRLGLDLEDRDVDIGADLGIRAAADQAAADRGALAKSRVEQEAVVDVGGVLEGVGVGQQAERRLGLPGPEHGLYLARADTEQERGLVAHGHPGLGEDVVGLAVAADAHRRVALRVPSVQLAGACALGRHTHPGVAVGDDLARRRAQTGLMSKVAVSFNHSTTTVPLKSAGFVGVRTRSLVVYGWSVEVTVVAHWPLEPQVPACP